MKRIAYILCFLATVLLCVLLFASCTKEGGNALSDHSGVYHIESMYWTGEIIDFNGDGVGERDMLHEFYGYPDYVKDWITGEAVLVDDSTLSFNSVIPVCVKSALAVQPEIKYYDIEIQAKWHNEWGKPGFSTETFEPVASDVWKGVKRAILYNISDSSYELHVECSLYTQETGIVNGTMIFSFKK